MNSLSIIEQNICNMLTELREFGSTPESGVTRLPFSNEAKAATEYLKNKMDSVGLYSHVDLVGNVHGVLKADCETADTIMIGSHYDTVKNGGEYDGIAGVVCGIEIARLINESGIPLKYNLEVVAFNDEEGSMFGSGVLGSKSITGQIDQEYINHMTDENGITISQWMTRWGSDPLKVESLSRDLSTIKAFYEIHIEQGPVLDTEKLDLGIVNCIVGLLRCSVTIKGRADHAGTTPMDMRQDTLLIASKVISKLDEFAAAENNGTVATCGFIRSVPNLLNVVAKNTEFTMDIRSKDDQSIANIKEKAVAILDKYTAETGSTYNLDIKMEQPAVYMNDDLVSRLSKKCEENDYSYKEMLSGAAHDAMVFADKLDTVMVFVPSKDGRSHCPEEFSSYSHLSKAVKIVYDTIKDII